MSPQWTGAGYRCDFQSNFHQLFDWFVSISQAPYGWSYNVGTALPGQFSMEESWFPIKESWFPIEKCRFYNKTGSDAAIFGGGDFQNGRPQISRRLYYEFVLKTSNFVSKTRNCVLKTRNLVHATDVITPAHPPTCCELQHKCQLFSEVSIENAEILWNCPWKMMGFVLKNGHFCCDWRYIPGSQGASWASGCVTTGRQAVSQTDRHAVSSQSLNGISSQS